MKVLFHCWEFPPNGTGVGTYVAQMTRALEGEGHRCVIVTGRADGYPEDVRNEHGRVLRLYDRSDLGAPWVARRVLETARAEGVDWIEGADHLGECAPLLRAPCRPPVVVRVHNSNPIRVVRSAEALYGWQRATLAIALWRNRRRYRAEKAMLERADAGCVPCRRLRDELVRQGCRRAEAFTVVPYAVAPVPARSAEGPVPTILFAGRIAIGKGIHLLPGVLRAALSRRPDAVLEIAGGDSYARGLGSLQDWLRRRFGDLSGRVRFLGRLGPGDMDAAYRRAWVLVTPSLWDNFPNVMLEAMVRGVPVVASCRGGMPEMLEGTGCPAVEPHSPALAEAVVRFLADEGLRRRAGAAARCRALSAYSPAGIARQYIEAVASSLGMGRTS